MKHHSTRAMFDYWNRRQGRRLVAARSDIDPTDIADVLPDAFLLSADFTDEIRFCLAGSRVCALFVRELKGESFKTLWANAGRGQVDAILNCVTDENEALVAGVLGRTEDGRPLSWNYCCCLLHLTNGAAFGLWAPLLH